MPNSLLRDPPAPPHGFSDLPRALREILYSTSDPTTLQRSKHVHYSEHTI